MSIYANIDLETFKWVKSEVEQTLEQANQELQDFISSDNKDVLFGLLNHLHQVVGSLQMLEFKSLAQLFLESERLVDDFNQADTKIRKASFVVLIDSAFAALKESFSRIEKGYPENPTNLVELINQIRAQRGLEEVEISSLFSPMIEVFPEVNSKKALRDTIYIKRAIALRAYYQSFLLKWLRGDSKGAVQGIGTVVDKLLQMSTFSSVARLWWVTSAYVDYVALNELSNKTIHARIFRQIDDRFRKLELQGESALVSDPGEELIKLMLFYTGVGENRSARMDEISDAFNLQDYFPALTLVSDTIGVDDLRKNLTVLRDSNTLSLQSLRQKVTHYFETEQTDSEELVELIGQFEEAEQVSEKANVSIVSDVLKASHETLVAIRKGIVEPNEDTGFHLASAIMFVESSLLYPEEVDDNWQENGELKLSALKALIAQEQLTPEMDGTHLTSSERQVLLDVVSNEVEENLKEIETKLENFSMQPEQRDLLNGIDAKVRQVRGALQVLGEQKVSLLLSMAEGQFTALEQGDVDASQPLTEALAISIGTMEEYVKGLQAGRTNMDYLLDRSITDLEVAIGKKVSRDDVENLLDNASDSLFSWLGNQSDFDLFTNVKESLRDLTALARKTKIIEVEHLVREQDRLVDVISQEPAFLTENITTNLQNNMASITEHIIQLYGTEETDEELAAEADLVYKKSAISGSQQGVLIHDEMDLEDLGDEAPDLDKETLSSTEIGKQNAVDETELPKVDDAIFDVFVEESEEVLEQANSQYQRCQENLNDRDAIRELRRAFHTIKGSSRMVGLTNIGEVAWFSESLFNYVLDTEKPLNGEILGFARDALDEIDAHVGQRYEFQHRIDASEWSAKTDAVNLDGKDEVEPSKESNEELYQTEDQADEAVTEPVEAPIEAPVEKIAEEAHSIFGNDIELELDDSELLAIKTDESEVVSDFSEAVFQDAEDDAIEEVTIDTYEIKQEDFDLDLDFEMTSASFSAIDDPEMRNVFVQEASANLEKITEQLTADTIYIKPDDVISISIHTLLGNARTMALDDVASVFDLAESLCLEKHENKTAIDAGERLALRDLVQAMSDCISEPQSEEPYFFCDQDRWDAVGSNLQTALDSQNINQAPNLDEQRLDDEVELIWPSENKSENNVDGGVLELDSSEESIIELDSDSLSLLDADESLINADGSLLEDADGSLLEVDDSSLEADDDVLELDVDDENVFELDADSLLLVDDSDELLVDDSDGSQKNSAERVAAAFEDIKLDDLLDDGASDVIAEPSQDDDLLDIETSLNAFKNDVNNESVDLADDVEPLKDESLDLEETLDAPSSESLLPDDLTDIMQDDLLDVDFENLDNMDFVEQVQSNEQEQQVNVNDDAKEAFSKDSDIVEAVVEAEPGKHALDDEPEAIESHDDSDSDISPELREIFVEEVTNIRSELDEEVSQLSELSSMAPVMANVMRHLHTIKGSSLMAEANQLGALTHHTESYLESSFIRNKDDLRAVRQTLEQYVDELDTATQAYQGQQQFNAPSSLLSRLGVEENDVVDLSAEIDQADTSNQTDAESVSFDDELQADIEQPLAAVVSKMDGLNTKWKSARGWKKMQPEFVDQYRVLRDLVNESPSMLNDALPLLDSTQSYLSDLKLSKSKDFKQAKALHQEAFDALVTSLRSLATGAPIESIDDFNIDDLVKQLSGDKQAELTTGTTDVVKNSAAALAAASTVDASIFVPGSTEISAIEQQELDRQNKAVNERAAALRIRTETLDSLTNFVGDASMNRSQMREDVVSIKSVVEELYSNVQRFGIQLRELEIEADSKITSRSNEQLTRERGEEFDPLELDRYTKLQQLSRGLAENLDELGGIQNSLSSFVYKTEDSLQKQDRLNRELQQEIMEVRLVSFGGIGPQLRQVVRRTARELDKDVELEIIGSDVRLDKTILDGVVPALEHMLRNAVDHGIEPADERRAKSKDKIGIITVECRQVAREIIISVRDDGRGLDVEKIRAQAIEDKLLVEDQALNPQDMLMYISQSGFSTAKKLTQISGRGVGMDVVQSDLRRMSGSISYDLENEQAGSHFIIRLPISLAVSSAVFVESGGEQFAIAARAIERIINVEVDELINHLKQDKPILSVDGQDYGLIDLADYLNYESKLSTLSGKLSVILVGSGVQNIAVIVDALQDTQEIVVKNLGGHLGRIPIYAGATIRANGQVVLLLDLVGISYYESIVTISDAVVSESQSIPTIMVVDDSLTVRKSAERDINGLGINSVLAKDGLDAQVQLQLDVPDMILLDIEMPNMDGFELLEWLKTQDNLKHIPVVMISSRATEKYVTKANELGCAAFLGKPYLLDNLVTLFNQHLTLDAPIELNQ